ncbi:MAG: sarcosine oxidase subunit gamma [Rhodobacteraceae bacterium]|nr:sarcosine oxidase subunit gamma [Paracoccaceae bacterium]
MSNAVSALQGEVYKGFATVADVGPSGMIALRGDLGAAKLKGAVKKATGVAVPGMRKAGFAGDNGVCWMSPDELLILCPYESAGDMTTALQEALAGTHHLAANVSDARARIVVSGGDMREVLAKLTPADVSAAAFVPGDFRRSRLAQVPAAFWMADDETVEVVCFRSVARYVFDILKNAAIPGSEAGFMGT